MGWNTANSSSSFNVASQVSNIIDGRGTRDLTPGNASGFGGLTDAAYFATGGAAGRSEYSIVGIKASQVEPMRQSIRTYVSNIQKYLEDALSNANANMDTAFRGSVLQDSVKAYLTKVKDYCDNLTSTLLAFSDKLADVSNAWLAATQQMSGNVNDAAGGFSAGARYTEGLETTSR